MATCNPDSLRDPLPAGRTTRSDRGHCSHLQTLCSKSIQPPEHVTCTANEKFPGLQQRLLPCRSRMQARHLSSNLCERCAWLITASFGLHWISDGAPKETALARLLQSIYGSNQLRMLRRWFQSATLALVALLLLSSQCYAVCAFAACATPQQHPDSPCHHGSKKTNHACSHQHVELSSPESGIEVGPLPSPGLSTVSSPHSPVTLIALQPSVFERVEPPRGSSSGRSTLALLSAFRI